MVQSICLTSRGSGVRIPQLPRLQKAYKSDDYRPFSLSGNGQMPVRCQLVINSQSLAVSEMGAKYAYREAVLSDSKGDISKTWYVNYYVWSEQKGQLIRKRGVFNQTTAAERYAAADEFIRDINDLLEEGHIVDPIQVDRPTTLTAKSTVADACETFLTLKGNTVDGETLRGYQKDIRGFRAWADVTDCITPPIVKVSDMAISKFGSAEVFAFSDHLDTKAWTKKGKDGIEIQKVGLAKKTYSNYIATLRNMWTLLISRKVIKESPWLDVTKRKGGSGQHIPYTPEQVREYKKVCVDELGDEQMWLFVNFIYYCFFRPRGEAQHLQVKHLKKKTIVVPGDIAKNNSTEHVRIPKGLEELIKKHKLRDYPSSYYIFSTEMKPGPEPVGVNYFYERNRKILDRARLKDQDYDLYGWKHTGNIALYQATKDIKLIQIQNRHKDINTTDIYLRSLGMFLGDDAFDNFPEPTAD